MMRNVMLRGIGLSVTALLGVAAPALAHPFHGGLPTSGPIHAMLHAMDAGGYLVAALIFVLSAAVVIKSAGARRVESA
jgi:hypothetical protein